MTKAELEKQLRKCERLLKKYSKCDACNGTGKYNDVGWRTECVGCHGSGVTSSEVCSYFNTKKKK